MNLTCYMDLFSFSCSWGCYTMLPNASVPRKISHDLKIKRISESPLGVGPVRVGVLKFQVTVKSGLIPNSKMGSMK